MQDALYRVHAPRKYLGDANLDEAWAFLTTLDGHREAFCNVLDGGRLSRPDTDLLFEFRVASRLFDYLPRSHAELHALRQRRRQRFWFRYVSRKRLLDAWRPMELGMPHGVGVRRAIDTRGSLTFLERTQPGPARQILLDASHCVAVTAGEFGMPDRPWLHLSFLERVHEMFGWHAIDGVVGGATGTLIEKWRKLFPETGGIPSLDDPRMQADAIGP